MCFGILFGLIAPTLLVHGHFPSIYKVTAKDICMLQGLFYAVVASCSFGLIPLFTLPLMQESIASSTILFARFGISSMIMGVILVLCRQPLAICRGDMWRLSVLGFFYAASAITFFWAFHYMDSGIVATVQYCYPVFVVVIMSCCFHEKLRKTTLIASFMSIAGVAMFSLHGSENVHFSMLGMGLTLLCATQTALYVIGIQITKTNVSNGLTVTFYLMASGAFFTGLFALVDGGLALPASTGQWVDMFLLAAITGVLSNLALVESIKKLGSSLAAILGGLEPVTAMCIGIFVFGEAFTARTILGTVLIVSAVIVVMLAPRQGKHQECSSC